MSPTPIITACLQTERALGSVSCGVRVQQLRKQRSRRAASSKRLSKLESSYGGLVAELHQTEEDLQAVQDDLQQVGTPSWHGPNLGLELLATCAVSCRSAQCQEPMLRLSS
jgi:hypothetical protein